MTLASMVVNLRLDKLGRVGPFRPANLSGLGRAGRARISAGPGPKISNPACFCYSTFYCISPWDNNRKIRLFLNISSLVTPLKERLFGLTRLKQSFSNAYNNSFRYSAHLKKCRLTPTLNFLLGVYECTNQQWQIWSENFQGHQKVNRRRIWKIIYLEFTAWIIIALIMKVL